MGWLSGIGTALGAVGGFLVGGPAGAAVGAGIGGSISGGAEGSKTQSQAFSEARGIDEETRKRIEELYANATAEQKKYLDQYLGYMLPYIGLGEKAAKDYGSFLTLDPELSPTYQWRKKQLLRELPASLAPSGLARSGVRSQLTAQGIESLLADEADKIYDRYGNAIQIGLGASSGAGGAVLNTGSNMANLSTGLSNAYARSGENRENIALAQGTAKAGLYRDIGQIPFNAMNTYTNYEFMNRLLPKTSGGSDGTYIDKTTGLKFYKTKGWQP